MHVRHIPQKAWRLTLFSGLLQVLIFPSPSWSFLSWIALAPLLYALLLPAAHESGGGPGRALKISQGFWLGYACGIVWYAGTCYWIFHVMHTFGGLSAPIAAGILLLFCMYLGLYHGLFGALLVSVGRGNGSVKRTLALAPFLWVATELARAHVTGFPWDLLGTAIVDNIPVTRIATATGVYGLSFLIVAVNALFVAAMISSTAQRRFTWAAAIGVALVLQSGRMAYPPEWKPGHIATLMQHNLPIVDPGEWTADRFDRMIAELVDMSRGPKDAANSTSNPDSKSVLSRNAPHLIVWPESPAPFYITDPKLRIWLSALAADKNAYIIVGHIGIKSGSKPGDGFQAFNSASLVGPSGAVLARYDKIHLVPFGEYVPFKNLFSFAGSLTKQVSDFTPGTGRMVFGLNTESSAIAAANAETHAMHESMAMPVPMPVNDPPQTSTGGGKVAVFICYESVFPNEVREFAAKGAQVFVNISNDGWFGDSGAPGQHLNMARMRAIENRRWLLRSTNNGITASIDPYGRVVAQAERNVRTALIAPYDFVSETTFYTRYNDLFAYACAIISLVATLAALRRRMLTP